MKDKNLNEDEIIKSIQGVSNRYSFYVVFSDLVEIFSIAISNRLTFNKEREDKYFTLIKKYNKDEMERMTKTIALLYEYLQEPVTIGTWHDRLGELYMGLDMGKDAMGQVFTPWHASQLCAKLTKTEGDLITIQEPTCGSGGMILAELEELAKNNVNYASNVLIVCGDIDKLCVFMTYLQLSLAGAAAIVKHQDAITQETWDVWETPAYIMNYCKFQKRR